MEEVKDRISVEHSYCAPLTPIEPQDGNTEIGSTVCTQLFSPVKCHPVSLAEIKKRCRKITERLSVDERVVDRIEKATVGQSANEKWNLHRKIRITASKCNRIGTLQETTSPTKAIAEVLHYKKVPQTRAMKEGLLRTCYSFRIYEIKETGQSKCYGETMWTLCQQIASFPCCIS